jgi:hypothetical protein
MGERVRSRADAEDFANAGTVVGFDTLLKGLGFREAL